MILLYPFQAKNQNIKVSCHYLLVGAELQLSFFIEDKENQIEDFYPLEPGEKKSLIFKDENLWKTTCFEIFFKNSNSADYYEFNFNSKAEWNLYYFSSYRERVSTFRNELIVMSQNQTDSGKRQLLFRFNIGKLVNLKLPCQINLAAILKINSEISYWSQKHNNVKPDFHDANNFILVLNSNEGGKNHG